MLLVFCYHLVFLFGWANSITLRVRLPSGQLQRLEVDDEATLRDCQEKLRLSGYLPEGSGVIFRSETIDFVDQADLGIVQHFKALNGEILSIIQPNTTTSLNNITSLSTKTTNFTASKSITQRRMSGTAGLEDIKKWRSNLIKITRQTTSGNLSVGVSNTTARIIKRLLNPGGLCILVGNKVFDDKQTNKTQINILGMFEVMNHDNLRSSSLINDLLKILEGLDLNIVGIGISLGTDLPTLSWSSKHIFSCLHLQDTLKTTTTATTETTSIASTTPPFVILSILAEKLGDTKASSGQNSIHRKGTVGSKASSPQLGLQLEAHHLSDLAYELVSKSILGMNESAVEASVAGHLTTLSLDKPVLVQSDEKNSIDALLLAVPIPILPLQRGVSSRRSSSSSSSTSQQSPPSPLSLHHSFPTPKELEGDVLIAKKTKVLVQKILDQSKNRYTEDLRSLFLDLHFLFYLRSFLDMNSIVTLSQYFSSCSTSGSVSFGSRLPAHITVLLDIFRTALHSASGVGGGSGTTLDLSDVEEL